MRKHTTAPPWGAPIIWRWVSERGLCLDTGGSTLAYYAALTAKRLPEIEDVIPADGTLLVILRRGAAVSAGLRAALAEAPRAEPLTKGQVHEVAVEYGGEAGPDLPVLAERAGLDVPGYINAHMAAEYTVAFLGFQPGFPYLRGLPRDLHAPRRASPRVRVAPGSVAIGGIYTGIYPASGPAGWQIIGRATVSLFDAERHPPALFAPGDRVRFVSI